MAGECLQTGRQHRRGKGGGTTGRGIHFVRRRRRGRNCRSLASEASANAPYRLYSVISHWGRIFSKTKEGTAPINMTGRQRRQFVSKIGGVLPFPSPSPPLSFSPSLSPTFHSPFIPFFSLLTFPSPHSLWGMGSAVSIRPQRILWTLQLTDKNSHTTHFSICTKLVAILKSGGVWTLTQPRMQLQTRSNFQLHNPE